MPAIIQIQDPDGNYYTDNSPDSGIDGVITIPAVNASENSDSDLVTQVIELNPGWSMFSTYLDVNAQVGSFANGKDIASVISAGLSGGVESIVIIKDNLGSAYLPTWNFNGIGAMTNGEGYQIKLTGDWGSEPHTLTLTGHAIETETSTMSSPDGFLVQEGTEVNYVEGWNLIGIPINTGTSGLPADVVFSELAASGFITIIKNNYGMAYLPEWGFNGLGNLFSGQAYQMRTTGACSMMFTGSWGLSGEADPPH